MTNEQKRKRITHWYSDMTQMQEVLDKCDRVIGLAPQGDLWHASTCMMSALTLTTAELVGDEAEWLEWFWLEADMGKKEGMIAGFDSWAGSGDGTGRHGMKRIEGLDDLFWLMGVDGD